MLSIRSANHVKPEDWSLYKHSPLREPDIVLQTPGGEQVIPWTREDPNLHEVSHKCTLVFNDISVVVSAIEYEHDPLVKYVLTFINLNLMRVIKQEEYTGLPNVFRVFEMHGRIILRKQDRHGNVILQQLKGGSQEFLGRVLSVESERWRCSAYHDPFHFGVFLFNIDIRSWRGMVLNLKRSQWMEVNMLPHTVNGIQYCTPYFIKGWKNLIPLQPSIDGVYYGITFFGDQEQMNGRLVPIHGIPPGLWFRKSDMQSLFIQKDNGEVDEVVQR